MNPPLSGTPAVLKISAIVYGIIGLALAGGGGWLTALHGSLFYLLAGIGLIATAVLMLIASRAALWIYALVLFASLAWSIHEIRFDWWPLASRIDVFFILGLWLTLPFVRRRLTLRRSDAMPLWAAMAIAIVVMVIGLASNYHDIDGALSAAPQPGLKLPASEAQPDEDWRNYARTQGGARYSPLAQITPANVNRLKRAWVYRTGEMPGKDDPVESTFEVTPLKIRDTLYLCSQHQRLIALDATTGRPRWIYDPHIRDNPTFQHLTCRGVSYHESPQGAVDTQGKPAPEDCVRTVFLPVNDGRMIAINADDGKPCDSFGNHGTLDLTEGMDDKTPGFYEPTSPPVVGDRILVVAGSVNDDYSTREPSGVIRGYDLYTGRLVWAWDAGAADENALPTPAHPFVNNSPNSWTVSAYDPALGLVYLPMGVQTPDIWGGNRGALAERYSSALVALDINTSKRDRSYQTVHHDLWDMDLPSQPSLVDLPTDHGVVPALIQPAKTGNLFVLDRRNGQLIVPAPELPVPQGAAAGDHVAPTQPFSALTFRPQRKLTGADMWGATIFDQLACRIQFHRMRYEGPFTPPSEQGTLVFPGDFGMFEWGGLAIDPERQLAIANPMSIAFVSKLVPRGPDNPPAPTAKQPPGDESRIFPMYGTPYGAQLHAFLSPLGIPCLQPPWGYIAGIDLKTLKVLWMHHNGTIRDSSPIPLPFKLGVPALGGPLTTAGGVAFLTSTLDYYIRAYDVTTGRQIWQDRLPAGGQSTPMTYAVNGRQYVVTADGGHPTFGTRSGDYVVAYTLGD